MRGYGKETEYEFDTQSGVREFTREYAKVVGPLLMSNDVASQLYGTNLDFEFISAKDNEFHKDPEVFFRLLYMKLNINDQTILMEETRLKIEHILSLISEQ